MWNGISKFLFVTGFVCLCLNFGVSSVFGQCGAPGTPHCNQPTKKQKIKRPKRKVNSSESLNSSLTNETEIYKSGSTFQKTVAGQILFVKYRETKDELIFLMEALNNFSDGKAGEIQVYVDLNGNGKIDVLDIRYKIIRDSENCKLESNYLSGKNFNSIALVGYSFTSTKYQSIPHPIWSLKIPKTEVFVKSGEIDIRFEYWFETCPNCKVKIPEYNDAEISNIRDANGLLEFGPVKKIKFNLNSRLR